MPEKEQKIEKRNLKFVDLLSHVSYSLYSSKGGKNFEKEKKNFNELNYFFCLKFFLHLFFFLNLSIITKKKIPKFQLIKFLNRCQWRETILHKYFVPGSCTYES